MNGVYVRYGIERHRSVGDALPGLGPVLYRKTYAVASREAVRLLASAIVNHPNGTLVYHPHQLGTPDPLNLFGSWGWKWGDGPVYESIHGDDCLVRAEKQRQESAVPQW